MLRWIQKCFPVAPIRRAGSAVRRLVRRSGPGVGATVPRAARRAVPVGAVIKAGGLACIMVPVLMPGSGWVGGPAPGTDDGWMPPFSLNSLYAEGGSVVEAGMAAGGAGLFALAGVGGGGVGRAPGFRPGQGGAPGVPGAVAGDPGIVAQPAPTEVPEPASLGLFLAGMLGLAAFRARRRIR